MRPAMYIFINKGLGMSTGKVAAQAAHAACLAADYSGNMAADPLAAAFEKAGERRNVTNDLWTAWWGTGHYTKFIMELPDTDRMFAVDRYLIARGFKTFLVIDEGHTEDTYFQPTALGVELVDKDDERTASIFKEFDLYRDEPNVGSS